MEREERLFQSPIVIEELLPSSLEIETFMRSGLVELVARSYGRDDIYFNLLHAAMAEYKGKDNKKTNFIAKIDNRPVGSVSTRNWQPDDGGTGTQIWEAIKSRDLDIYNKTLNWPIMCYVVGVVVDPDFRSQGIGGRLYYTLAEKIKPSIIWGDTKTPQAVFSRANSLASLGYRTFYGEAELTPGRYQEHAKEHLSIIEADAAAEQYTYEEGLIYWQDIAVLPSYIPDVSSFPDPIKKSFEDLIRAQRNAGQGRTASKPLVSIRSEIIPNNP